MSPLHDDMARAVVGALGRPARIRRGGEVWVERVVVEPGVAEVGDGTAVEPRYRIGVPTARVTIRPGDVVEVEGLTLTVDVIEYDDGTLRIAWARG